MSRVRCWLLPPRSIAGPGTAEAGPFLILVLLMSPDLQPEGVYGHDDLRGSAVVSCAILLYYPRRLSAAAAGIDHSNLSLPPGTSVKGLAAMRNYYGADMTRRKVRPGAAA
jgi:hypothetical protein